MIFNRGLEIIKKRGLTRKRWRKNRVGYDPPRNYGLVRFIKSIR